MTTAFIKDLMTGEARPQVVMSFDDFVKALEFYHEKKVKEETEDRWITPKEAAQMLGVEQSTICRWSKEGRLTPHRVDGSKRVYYSMLQVKGLPKKL